MSPVWIPGPWGNFNGAPVKPQPDSPHQAAIAEPKPVKRTTRETQKDG